MDNMGISNEIPVSSEENRDYPSEVLTEICAIYPFLNKEEYDNFEEGVKNIRTVDPLEEIKEMLELLNNPHTRLKEIDDDYFESKFNVPEKYKPSSEIFDNVLYLKIPTFSGIKLEDIENVFVEYYKNSEGLIIDLRDNMGGQQLPGQAFAEKYLLKPGRHEFGINITRSPENELHRTHTHVRSNNESYYSKPVVILTNDRTFSSSERFIAILKAGSECTVIGSDTKGGSANPGETVFSIGSKKYLVNIPTWRFILPGQVRPIEETKIKPDIEYTKEDIIAFSVNYIKNKTQEKP